jgi:hypothetical protein
MSTAQLPTVDRNQPNAFIGPFVTGKGAPAGAGILCVLPGAGLARPLPRILRQAWSGIPPAFRAVQMYETLPSCNLWLVFPALRVQGV